MRIGSQLSGLELTAQHNLLQALSQQSASSVRLATMQRINRGSDDPAGLIAVEQMRAELTAIQEAEHNASRAAGLAQVADSALSEVGDLLISIQGNVGAAAGGFSDAEVEASQLEINAALDAINRIGNTTSYGGRKLFDGSAGDLTFLFSADVAQTTTLELPTVSTAELGTATGRLSDLASGGSASLTSDNLAEAAEIINAAQSQILDARARTGALEKYTIESSQRLLGSMEENLSSAVSSIFDADVAVETSNMTRSQILVDAGISSLMIANQRRGLIGRLLGGM